MEPNGLKSSCRSVSRVSSDRLVTRIVALSSAAGQKSKMFRHLIHEWLCGCQAHWIKRTSPVGLHGLPSSGATVPQAGGHILPSLALSRLCRFGFRFSKAQKGKNVSLKHTSTKRMRRTLNIIIAMMHWKYLNLQAYPCLRWKVQAVQPAPSAWDPGCPCMDSEWSNGLLCKYDKTQSSVLSACSWDPHPGLGHLGPILVKKRYNHSG